MAQRQKIHYAWWIMVSCCVMALTILGFMANGTGIFLAPVSEDLGFSRGALAFYLTILQLVMIVSLPIAGKMFSKFDIRLLLVLAMIVYAGGFVLMSRGTSLLYWYAAGFLQGIAGGFLLYLPVPILINNWFKAKTGFALGLALAFSGVGGAIINPINQYFITTYSWRAGYIALAIIALVVSLPFLIFVVRFKPSDLGLQPYGAEAVQDGPAPELTGLSAKAALKTPSLYLMFFAGALLCLTVNFNQHLPGYLSSIGYPAMVVATVVSTVMVGVIIGKVALGFLNDKFGLKAASAFGLLGGTLAMILLLAGQANIYIVYAGALCYGLGYSMLTVEPPLILKAIFGPKEFSSIYSYVSTTQAIVGAASIYIFGLIFDLTQSFAADLIIVALAFLLSLVCIFAALNLGKNLQAPDSSKHMGA